MGSAFHDESPTVIAHWGMARECLDVSRWDEAIEHLRAAIDGAAEGEPDHALIRECGPPLLLQTLARQERWEDADAFLRLHLDWADGDELAGLHQALAATLLERNRPVEAIGHLQQAADWACWNAEWNLDAALDSLLLLGVVQIAEAPDGAVQTFERLGTLAGQVPRRDAGLLWRLRAWDGEAQAHLRAGRPELALAASERALTALRAGSQPDAVREGGILLHLVEALLELGRGAEARAQAEHGQALWQAAGAAEVGRFAALLARC